MSEQKLVIEGDVLLNFIDELIEWEDVAKQRDCPDTHNWKRSAIARENRRESIVYGNCLEQVKAHLGRRQVNALMEQVRKEKEASDDGL